MAKRLSGLFNASTTPRNRVGENPLSLEDMVGEPVGKGVKPTRQDNAVFDGSRRSGKGIATPAPRGLKGREHTNQAKAKTAGAIVGAGLEVINAYEKFKQISARAQTNIMLAHQNAASAISAGKELALRAETRGQSRGQDALLGAAAQGQDVRGSLAGSLQEQEEIAGLMESLQIEVNSIREAHGFEAEAVMYASDVEFAKIQRDQEIFNSVARGGTTVLGALA